MFYGCSITSYATEVVFLNYDFVLLRAQQVESVFTNGQEKKQPQDVIFTSATHDGLVWRHRHRLPARHELYSGMNLRPCFRNFQTLIFNKLDHNSTDKLLWVYHSFHSRREDPECFLSRLRSPIICASAVSYQRGIIHVLDIDNTVKQTTSEPANVRGRYNYERNG